MQHYLHKTLLFSLLIFSLLSCKDQNEDLNIDEDLVEVVILHTNDEHANIEQFSKLQKLVERERSLNKNLLLVSAGDFFSGNPFVDYAEEPGEPMINLMNLVGYDLALLGNHDFDYGLDILNKRISESQFPIILANVQQSDLLRGISPYQEFHFEDIDISLAFVGLIQTGANGIPSTLPRNVEGLEFEIPENLNNGYPELKNRNNAVIGLTHLGFDRDLSYVGRNQNFNPIIGGHSHTALPYGRVENGILVAQAGSHLSFVGKTILVFRNGNLIQLRNFLISLENYPESDPSIQELINRYLSNPVLETVITNLENPISGIFQLACLMTDALRVELDVDIAFQNAGGIRLESLSAGPVKISDILTLDPFRNDVVVMELNQQEIINLIQTRTSNTGLIDLLPSGIQYTIFRDNQGNYSGLELELENGEELDPNKKYRVAVNSFIGTTYEFERADQGEMLFYQTSDLLIQYLQNNSNLNYEDCTRVTLR